MGEARLIVTGKRLFAELNVADASRDRVVELTRTIASVAGQPAGQPVMALGGPTTVREVNGGDAGARPSATPSDGGRTAPAPTTERGDRTAAPGAVGAPVRSDAAPRRYADAVRKGGLQPQRPAGAASGPTRGEHAGAIRAAVAAWGADQESLAKSRALISATAAFWPAGAVWPACATPEGTGAWAGAVMGGAPCAVPAAIGATMCLSEVVAGREAYLLAAAAHPAWRIRATGVGARAAAELQLAAAGVPWQRVQGGLRAFCAAAPALAAHVTCEATGCVVARTEAGIRLVQIESPASMDGAGLPVRVPAALVQRLLDEEHQSVIVTTGGMFVALRVPPHVWPDGEVITLCEGIKLEIPPAGAAPALWPAPETGAVRARLAAGVEQRAVARRRIDDARARRGAQAGEHVGAPARPRNAARAPGGTPVAHPTGPAPAARGRRGQRKRRWFSVLLNAGTEQQGSQAQAAVVEAAVRRAVAAHGHDASTQGAAVRVAARMIRVKIGEAGELAVIRELENEGLVVLGGPPRSRAPEAQRRRTEGGCSNVPAGAGGVTNTTTKMVDGMKGQASDAAEASHS